MPEQGKKLQGFPDSFELPVSKVAAMKQLGNSVAVDAIYHCGKSLIDYMFTLKQCDGMNNRSNKGEWTELYSLLSLINSKYLELGDKHLNVKTGVGFNVTKVKTLNSPNEYVLGSSDSLVVRAVDGSKENIVSTSSIINDDLIKTLADRIKNGKGRTFTIEEFEVIKSKLGLYATKGGTSKQKADLIADLSDSNGSYPEEGLGIKSYLGSKPTLLNASGSNTNFVYKIVGCETLDLEAINAINTNQKVKKRLAAIKEAGGKLVFDRVEADTMEHNLKMIDSSMPKIIAEMLKRFYLKRQAFIKDCVICIHDAGELIKDVDYGSLDHLEKITKKFLVGIMLGFFTGEEWNGERKANGTIVVKNDGSQVGYHIVDEATMENYLFEHIKFDTPSTTRHRFASIVKEADGYYFKLNLQLRF